MEKRTRKRVRTSGWEVGNGVGGERMTEGEEEVKKGEEGEVDDGGDGDNDGTDRDKTMLMHEKLEELFRDRPDFVQVWSKRESGQEEGGGGGGGGDRSMDRGGGREEQNSQRGRKGGRE
eukprot:763158-Hanusia_phi.AAC.3